jgi:c-di-GMP-related signal transduction protein
VTAPSTALNSDKGKLAPKPGTQFVARQPILTADEKVFGYELLFRDGVEDFFRHTDADAASRSTLNTAMLLGLDVLTDGRRAFVNCTRDILLKDYNTLLPSEQAVVEVLESVPADDLVIAACRQPKESGYTIALDDFGIDDRREPLTDVADIIKVDLRATSAADAAAMVKRYDPWRCRMLAEKVETREEFVTAKKAGFLYFQGYFFRRPEMLTAHEIPANQLDYLRMLTAVSQAELNVREIEHLVKGEASLCYRLLRYLNSASFGFANEIHSVRHALSILGEREVRRWIRLVATLGAGQGKSSELVLFAMVRARFCEPVSPKIPQGGLRLVPDGDAFGDGRYSRNSHVPGARQCSHRQGEQGSAAWRRQPSAAVLSTDAGARVRRVETASELAAQLHLAESEVAECYWQAMQWARQISSGA